MYARTKASTQQQRRRRMQRTGSMQRLVSQLQHDNHETELRLRKGTPATTGATPKQRVQTSCCCPQALWQAHSSNRQPNEQNWRALGRHSAKILRWKYFRTNIDHQRYWRCRGQQSNHIKTTSKHQVMERTAQSVDAPLKVRMFGIKFSCAFLKARHFARPQCIHRSTRGMQHRRS